jgi:hypothetical protein
MRRRRGEKGEREERREEGGGRGEDTCSSGEGFNCEEGEEEAEPSSASLGRDQYLTREEIKEEAKETEDHKSSLPWVPRRE